MLTLFLVSQIPQVTDEIENALKVLGNAMVNLIVGTALMNLFLSVPAPLISLLALMVQNASPSQMFAMVTAVVRALAMTIHTPRPPCVTTVLLKICSGVRCQVLTFA